jgi:hypothetical protein
LAVGFCLFTGNCSTPRRGDRSRGKKPGIWPAEIGFEDDLIDDNEAARAELGEEYSPPSGDESPALIYPLVHWRDPVPNPDFADIARRDRIARGLTLKAEATRQGILVSELTEIERGCLPGAGLTTLSGAEPLRRALRQWARHWCLPDWCFDWVLERLRAWPPKEPLDYPLDPIGTIAFPAPRLPSWDRHLQQPESYIESMKKLLAQYCAQVDRLIECPPTKRGPSDRRAYVGPADRHFFWLAGYQCCGWSKNAIAEAIRINRAAVVRAIPKLANQIGLPLRPNATNDRNWTPAKIRAALSARLT